MSTKRIFAILVFLAIFAFALTEISDPDFGWHLKTGEYIVTQMKIPQRDIFSFTALGQPWITEEWLTEVVIYLLFQAGSYPAVMIFFALVPAIALTLVYLRTATHQLDTPADAIEPLRDNRAEALAHPAYAAMSVLFAAWVVSAYWGTRPQMISFLFASIFLFILEHYRREGAGKFLWWLVPAMLIWTNAHGGFAVGPVLILVYLLADAAQVFLRWDGNTARLQNLGRLAYVLFACLFVIAFNPNGVALYAYPFQTLLSPVIQNVLIEWQPPVLGSPEQFPFILYLTALLTALVAARRNFGLIEIIMLLGLTFAGLRATRQIALWVLVAAPILAASASEIAARVAAKPFERIRVEMAQYTQVAFVAGVIALGALAGVRVNSAISNQPLAERQYFPVSAVKYIQDKGLSGPIFNRYEWGGYLIWKLYPQEKVFIDGRTDVYGLTDTFFYHLYSGVYNVGPDWRDTLARYNIRLVLVDVQSTLANTLAKDSGWSKEYADDQAVVFKRK